MKKPRINTRCKADDYSTPAEKIIEYTFPNGMGGGLISFRQTFTWDGEDYMPLECLVTVYHHDPRIKIIVGMADKELDSQ